MMIEANHATGHAQAAPHARHASIALAPLGVGLTITTDNQVLADTLVSSCRDWTGVDGGTRSSLHLHLETGPVVPAAPAISIDGSILSVQGGAEGWADASTGRGWCRVPSAAVLTDPVFRERVLDSLILWLVTRRDRTPLHASAFMTEGVAVLLAGRSGSGKSCLAQAADRAGFRLMTDDTVYLQMGNGLRVWAVPRPVHLYPEDAVDHPDAPIRLRNGKRKRAIDLPQSRHASTADAAILCVLRRGTRVALDPIGRGDAIALLGPHEPGFDLLSASIDAALHRLTRRGAWRLTLGTKPDDAMHLLAANMPRLMERATS